MSRIASFRRLGGLALTAGLLGIGWSNAAGAVVILTNTTGIEATGASAKAEFTFTDTSTTIGSITYDVDLALKLTNTSANPPLASAALTAYAFDLPGGYTLSFLFDEANGWELANNSLPPLGTFDVCIESPDTNSNCQAGKVASAIAIGSTLTFGFLFDSNFTAAQYESAFQTGYTNGTLSSAARFQGIDLASTTDEVEGLSDKVPNNPPTTVPEPGTLALLGIGLIGLGWAVSRRRRIVEEVLAVA